MDDVPNQPTKEELAKKAEAEQQAQQEAKPTKAVSTTKETSVVKDTVVNAELQSKLEHLLIQQHYHQLKIRLRF